MSGPRIVSCENENALALMADDDLPRHIRLLLRYDVLLPVEKIRDACLRAFENFPYFTGRFVREAARIIPHGLAENWFEHEQWEENKNYHPEKIFLDEERLFFVRIITVVESMLTWVEVNASHRVVDGMGLGLFYLHWKAALQNGCGPSVVHDRAVCNITIENPEKFLGEGYVEVCPDGGSCEAILAEQARVFVVSFQQLESVFHTSDIHRLRLRFAGALCESIMRNAAEYQRVALWCNARGAGAVPQNYTGNAGCFMMLPHDQMLADSFAHFTTSGGAEKIRQQYAALQSMRLGGRQMYWQREGVVQCNLIHAPSVLADMGLGRPVWGALLARNSRGLRLLPSANHKQMIVEAAFDENLLEVLSAEWRDRYLSREILLDSISPHE